MASPVPSPPPPNLHEPYCGHCGYVLTGLTDSSKCPECGRPIVEVLMRGPRSFAQGRRFRSRATLFGWPVIHVALGPHGNELRGHARGIVAVGDTAVGAVAIGGVAAGGVAVGGVAAGLVSLGGLALGLIAGAGGVATGALAGGGLAAGALANGGLAVGALAQGGLAVGYAARGGMAVAPHVPPDPLAVSLFDRFGWFFGGFPPAPPDSMMPIVSIAVVAAVLAAPVVALALWKHFGADEDGQDPSDPGPSHVQG